MNSSHNWKHKMSAWNNMIYRLINIPMDNDAFDKELNLIIKITTFNGYKKKRHDSKIS